MIARITAAAIIALALAVAAAVAQDENGLPDGKGREEVVIYCSACHSLKLVTQQGLSRQAWDDLLVWMVEEQGMEEIPPKDREIVLDYLARELSIERVRELRSRR